MTLRRNAIILAATTLVLPAAFAQSTSSFVGGESGFIDQPLQGGLSRAQVIGEYLQLRANPVDRVGGRVVGGEEGYAFPAHSYALKNGRWVCTDNIAHNPEPDAIMSPAEAAHFQQFYPA